MRRNETLHVSHYVSDALEEILTETQKQEVSDSDKPDAERQPEAK